MAGTAAIYTRISKDRESTELGVQRQEQLARDLAKRKGLEVVAVFSDNDTSASTKSSKARPQYAEMMARARAGEFSTIVAYSNSRLTRRPRELLDLLDLNEKNGTKISTVATGELDLSLASGRALAITVAAWDSAEAEQASERIKAAKQQRRDSGKWHGGKPPFGYRAEGGSLVVEPSEKALVQQAAKRVLAGDSLASVVKSWNDAGVTTRSGKHWRQTNLRHVLMNRSCLGETKAGVLGWDPVLDRRDFDRLTRIFTDPARKVTHSPGVKSSKNSMGGGITVCARCGKTLTTHNKQDSEGKYSRAALACLARVNGPDPVNHPRNDRGREQFRVTVDHDRLEEYVFESIVASLAANPRWGQKLGERGSDVDDRINALENERDALLEKQRRLHDSYLEGLVDDAYHRTNVRAIKAQHEAIQKKINDLLGGPLLSEAIADGLNWREWSSDKRRNFLRVAGVRVEVDVWPDGMSRNLPPFRGESAEALATRRRDHLRKVIEKRVRIIV